MDGVRGSHRQEKVTVVLTQHDMKDSKALRPTWHCFPRRPDMPPLGERVTGPGCNGHGGGHLIR